MKNINKKAAKRLLTILLSAVLLIGSAASLAGCAKEESEENRTVVLGLPKTWETLRVTDFMNVATHQVGTQIYDKLAYIDENYVLHPRGADSWEFSEDGKTLTFHLNEKATWHDGEKVTAEDYVFSYKFYATSEVQFMYRPGTKYLEGVDPSTGVEQSTDSAAVKAVDEYTLELSLNNIYNQSEYLYSALSSFIVLPKHCFVKDDGTPMSDEEIYNDTDYWNAPIGSGPFKYVSDIADNSITLAADDDYHLGRPDFDTLIMQVIDTSTAVDKILSGDVDILGFNLCH